MKNTNLFILIGAIVILAAIATISIDSCVRRKNQPPVSDFKNPKDSVEIIKAETKRIVDSIQKVNARLTKEKDSLKRVASKSIDLIELKKIKARAAQREYELSRKYADTPTAFSACDSMVAQITALSNEVDSAIKVNRQLQNTNDSLLGNSSLHIARLDFDNSFLKEKFDKVASEYDKVKTENQRLRKKANKRFGAGPSITGTYWDGKPRIIGGVSFHYSLIRL